MNWRDKAACLAENPELFFPIGSAEPAMIQQQQAKKVCARCVVREECLQWAIDVHQDHGVWGGLGENERRALRRRAARARVHSA